MIPQADYRADRLRHERQLILHLLGDPENWVPHLHRIRDKSGLGAASIRRKIEKIMESNVVTIDHHIQIKEEGS